MKKSRKSPIVGTASLEQAIILAWLRSSPSVKRFALDPIRYNKFSAAPVDPRQGNYDVLIGVGAGPTNFRDTMNGYMYADGPMPTMKKGDHVRWYVMSIGEGFNFHTPHWHGNTVLVNGARTDVLSLAPAQMITADMVADNPGRWLFHCHVSDHMEAGMASMYEVLP
jgi:FtsP/CotA-like multicopper oxidase with cupredoxin domain